MPEMDGEQVAENIRKDTLTYWPQPVIVAISADASLEHRLQCLSAGMDDLIGKPIRLGMLAAGMQRWKSMLEALRDDADTTVRASAAETDLLSKVQERIGPQDELFLSDYIELFVEYIAMRLQKLAEAMEQQDAVALKRECHSLKGACLELGMSRMGRYCDVLRHSAESENWDNVSRVLSLLNREFERIRPVIETE